MPVSIFLVSAENLNYIYFYCLFAFAVAATVAFVSSIRFCDLRALVHCVHVTYDGKLSSSGQAKQNKRKI